MIDLGNIFLFQVPRRGWLLNTSIVKLPSGGLLVHSPTHGGDGLYSDIEKLGTPEILLAPNHYHHMSLRRYRERWPQARAVCSDAARPRLTKKGHAGLGGLDGITLPEGARFIVVPHVKQGEVWLSLPGAAGPTWIVCDGFFNMTTPVRGMMGIILRALDVQPGLKLGRTYKFLMTDKRAYRSWLLQLLRDEPPARVVFSHGDPILDGAAAQLTAEAERSLARWA